MHFDNKQKIRQLIYLIKKDTFSSGIEYVFFGNRWDRSDQASYTTTKPSKKRKYNYTEISEK